jgi:hypothetical protein
MDKNVRMPKEEIPYFYTYFYHEFLQKSYLPPRAKSRCLRVFKKFLTGKTPFHTAG